MNAAGLDLTMTKPQSAPKESAVSEPIRTVLASQMAYIVLQTTTKLGAEMSVHGVNVHRRVDLVIQVHPCQIIAQNASTSSSLKL